MLKILQARLQQYMKCDLPDVQAGFRSRDQIANIHWIIEKAREFQKNIYFCFIDNAKAVDCVDRNKVWKILKEMGIPDHLTASWEICMQVKKQQLELDMEQQTGSRLRKEYIKAIYCHSAYLTYLQSTSCIECQAEAQVGIKIARRNINNLRLADDTTLKAESKDELKSLLKVKEENEKSALKLGIQKTKIMASSPITSGQTDGEKMETVTDFIFLGSKITMDGVCSYEI